MDGSVPSTTSPRNAAATVVGARRDTVARALASEVDDADVLLGWLQSALERCDVGADAHTHDTGGRLDGPWRQPQAVPPSSVRTLRSVLHDEVLDALPEAAARGALDCIRVVLDDAMARALASRRQWFEELAYLDPLTGLGNRRAADELLRAEVGVAERYGRLLGVVVVDLDGLKLVNDQQGHAAGDRLLRALADAFRSELRDGDRAFRIGGDEFLVLVPETDGEGVDELMRRVRHAGAPALSYGVAMAPDDGVLPDALLRVADQRLLAWRRGVRSTPQVDTAAAPAAVWPLVLALLVLGAAVALALAARLG